MDCNKLYPLVKNLNHLDVQFVAQTGVIPIQTIYTPMTYTPPTYFEQPHSIIGYRVVGFSPIRLQDPEYAKCLLTTAVNLEPTWAAAWVSAQNCIKDTQSFPSSPVKIGLEDFDTFSANPVNISDYRHRVEVGNAPVIEVNTGTSLYMIAITAVLGEELDCDNFSDSDSE